MLILNISNDWTRVFLVLIFQMLIGFTFLIFAYKILKRKITKLTLYLAFFFLLESCAAFINAIIIGLDLSILVVFLYYLSYFILYFGLLFFLIFLISFFEEEFNLNYKKTGLVIIIYSVIIISVLNFPGGISFAMIDNWRPKWSWNFLIVSYVFISGFYTFPILFFSYKLLKYIQYKSFKKRIKFFLIGTSLMLFQLYGLVLYNTWESEIYRISWSFLTLINISTPILLYLGVGKDF